VKILITKFKSLGDVILLTPLIKNFKKAHPYARIDILLRNGTGQILANNPDIQEILTLGDHKSKLINFLIYTRNIIFSIFPNFFLNFDKKLKKERIE